MIVRISVWLQLHRWSWLECSDWLILWDGCVTVVQAVVASRKSIGVEWLKYSLHVVSRYKFPASREPRSSAPSSSSSSSSGLPAAEAGSDMMLRRLDNAWTHVDDVACACPKLTVGGTYLLAGWTHSGAGGGHGGLVLGRDSVVMPWRSSWSRRLKRLARYQQHSGCWTDEASNSSSIRWRKNGPSTMLVSCQTLFSYIWVMCANKRRSSNINASYVYT